MIGSYFSIFIALIFDNCSLLQVVVFFFQHKLVSFPWFMLLAWICYPLASFVITDWPTWWPTGNLPLHLLPAVSTTMRKRSEIRIAALILRTWLFDILLWTEDCVHWVLIGKSTNGVFTNSQTEVEIPEMSRKLQPFIIHRTDHQLHTICELAQGYYRSSWLTGSI